MVKHEKVGRILGMNRAARELGVTRQHLRAVLVGRRQSRRLSARYAALRRENRHE